jgi:ribosomal protein S16
VKPIKPGIKTSQIYESDYIGVELLKLKGAQTLTIQGAFIDDIYNPHSGNKEEKIVLTFAEIKKKLIVGPVLSADIEKLTGSDEPIQWVNSTIKIHVGSYNNRAATRVVQPPHRPTTNPPKQTNGGRPYPPDVLAEKLNEMAKIKLDKITLSKEPTEATTEEKASVYSLLRSVFEAGQVEQFVSKVFGDKISRAETLAMQSWLSGKDGVSPIAKQEAKLAIHEWGLE